MSRIEVLEEKHIVKIQEFVFLWNPTDYDIEMKFDGKIYSLPSGKALKLRENVCRCLLNDYSHLGIVQVSDVTEEELESKRPVGLGNLYNFLMDQLHSWVSWMSDQKRIGNGIIGEPLRVKELKVLIADLEDELELPRQLGPDVYEEIEADRQRLFELKKGRKLSFTGPQVFVPQPVASKSTSDKSKKKTRGRKKVSAAENKKEENFEGKYFSDTGVYGGISVNEATA